MTRLAALAAALLPIPASAGCPSAPELVAAIRPTLPETGFVGLVPSGSMPTVLAWLEAADLPHDADAIVQVVGDRGIALVLVQGQSCEGRPVVTLIGAAAADLVGLVRRYRALRGWGPELGA
ncbi:hypothetical protein FV226_07650 [Methylobacterium sp. WL12]|uniref:hypothetical protein n=1 Tax=Methylobacterium sp. WL12 TaxID=2603890 RepID=UPI0011C8ADF3|nr:hypothetical protein [Methylobacterium sp. WL12]TXM74142.1 hypothetical protein FV226_07650 [Methylobacterium sp. WL12]